MSLKKVISGGQTGADQAALYAAKDCGIPTGGWIPKGCPTTNGNNPSLLEKFGLQEHSSDKYSPRTYANVKDSDGTLRIAKDFTTRGEICTEKALIQYGKPYYDIDVMHVSLVSEVIQWLITYQIRILNVAGNSERSYAGMFTSSYSYLMALFSVI